MSAACATRDAAPRPARPRQQHALGVRCGAAIVAGRAAAGPARRQEDVAERIGISIAPVREALRVLEQEGQVTYLPRRGYFVTELRIADLEEIYELRRAARGARGAPRAADARRRRRCERIALAAARLRRRRRGGRRRRRARGQPPLSLRDASTRPTSRTRCGVIRLLWDSTEAYRALYYNSPDERRGRDRGARPHHRRGPRRATPTGWSPSSTPTRARARGPAQGAGRGSGQGLIRDLGAATLAQRARRTPARRRGLSVARRRRREPGRLRACAARPTS